MKYVPYLIVFIFAFYSTISGQTNIIIESGFNVHKGFMAVTHSIPGLVIRPSNIDSRSAFIRIQAEQHINKKLSLGVSYARYERYNFSYNFTDFEHGLDSPFPARKSISLGGKLSEVALESSYSNKLLFDGLSYKVSISTGLLLYNRSKTSVPYLGVEADRIMDVATMLVAESDNNMFVIRPSLSISYRIFHLKIGRVFSTGESIINDVNYDQYSIQQTYRQTITQLSLGLKWQFKQRYNSQGEDNYL